MTALRRETTEDLPFLAGLYAETRKEELDAAGLTGPIRDAFLRQQFEAMMAGYARSFPSADQWIIQHEHESAGRLIVNRGLDEIRLVDIAVLSRFRGLGIGADVIRRLQERAISDRVPLRLQVFEGSRALRLYHRLGFVATGIRGLRVQMEWSPDST